MSITTFIGRDLAKIDLAKKDIHSLILRSAALLGLIGLLILLAIGQAAQAREGDGAATGLSVQAATNAPLLGLSIDLTAAQVGEQSAAPFDSTDTLLNLDALSGKITADTVTAHTQYQPFSNVIDSDASTANLSTLLSLLGVNLVNLSSTTLTSTAQVSGSCGNFTATGTTTIEGLNLTVLGQTVATNLNSTPVPNTELSNTNINIGLVGSTLSAHAQVILNEQTVAGDQSTIAVNALHIHMDITVTGLTNLTQSVDIIVSHSEAGFTNCNDVDLSVDKTTSLGISHATVSVPFDYTVTITNQNATNPATAVQFTDTLDTETTFVSFINQGGGNCTHNGTNPGGIITCQWSTVPAGGSVAATYRVNPTTTGTATNNVTVTTGDHDTDPNDDTDSVSVTIDPAGGTTTDLAVSFVNSTPADGQVGAAQNVDIQITNSGAPATNATLIYTVSPGATINSVSGTGSGSCVINGNTLNCGPTNVPNNFNQTWTVNITPTIAGPNTHTVNVASTVPDSNPSNNTAQATVNVTAAQNVILQANVTDSPDPDTEGQPVTYTIDVTNTGTAAATNVVLNVGLSGVPVTIDSATPGQGSCTILGTQVSCTLNTLGANGGTTQVVIIATPNGAGTLSLTGTVVDDASHSAPVTASTTITATEADLSITKTVSSANALLGQLITYTLEITNGGPSDASNVIASDTLPPQVAFVSATPTQGICTQAATVVTCNLGNLSNSATASVQIVVRAVSHGTANNTATVSSDTSDPDPTNDTSSPVHTLISPSPNIIPTLSEYGLLMLLGLMALLVMRTQVRSQRRE